MRRAILVMLLLPVLWSSTAPQTTVIKATTLAEYQAAVNLVVINRRATLPNLTTAKQECTASTASTLYREVIIDSAGYPFGEVAEWSCTDPAAARARFEAARIAKQAEANAFRAAHPLATPRPNR